jgi:metal-responsive CopG/Arc/MetJ family transcriptional regulator
MATGKVQVNVYLEKAIVRKLDEARSADGLSRSAVIGKLVRRYLRKREKRLETPKLPGQRGTSHGGLK